MEKLVLELIKLAKERQRIMAEMRQLAEKAKIFDLCGIGESDSDKIHIFKGITKIAQTLDIDLDIEQGEKVYFYWDKIKFFQLLDDEETLVELEEKEENLENE